MVYFDPRTGATLGGALRQWRVASDQTLAAAAEHCGVPLTHLVDVESDVCGPSAAVLTRLASLYDRAPDIPAGKGWATVIMWLRVFTDDAADTNRKKLEIVARSIREMRGLGPEDRVRMRDPEGDILISILDLSDPDIMVDIMESFGMSSGETREFISASARRVERRRGAHEPITRRILDADWGDPAAPAA